MCIRDRYKTHHIHDGSTIAFGHSVLLRSIGGSKLLLYACLLTEVPEVSRGILSSFIAPLPLHSHPKRYDVVLNEVSEGVDRLILRSHGVDCFPSRTVIGELADVL